MKDQLIKSQEQQLEMAQHIKAACIRTALESYESAAMSGLCCEGAWEAAVSAMQMLDLEPILQANQREY